jgi:hypothetical protein
LVVVEQIELMKMSKKKRKEKQFSYHGFDKLLVYQYQVGIGEKEILEISLAWVCTHQDPCQGPRILQS